MRQLLDINQVLNQSNWMIQKSGNRLGLYDSNLAGECRLKMYSLLGKNLISRCLSLREEYDAPLESKLVDLSLDKEIIRQEDFKQSMRLIEQGKINKAVWYNSYYFDFHCSKAQLIHNFLRSAKANCIIYDHANSIFMINSPEILLESAHGSLKTYAIAGTSQTKDGLRSEKILREHRNVEIDIEAKLGADLSRSEVGVVEFEGFFHLKSEFSFKHQLEFESVARALAPTSAVFGEGGCKEDILSGSSFMRNDPWYGGYTFIDSKDKKAIVNIRAIEITDQIIVHTGCGLVRGSVFEEELHESKLKRDKVIGLLL